MRPFQTFDWVDNAACGDLDHNFPCRMLMLVGNSSRYASLLTLDVRDTYYIYVHSGSAIVRGRDTPAFDLARGMFAVIPGGGHVQALGHVLLMVRENYFGAFQIGGPIEWEGRLKYIDGCTDSLLSAPVRKGDPCLNLLYFPEQIWQTAHTHPSTRLGMVMSGEGICRLYDEDGTNERITPLTAGMVFNIPAGCVHAFATDAGKQMRVLAFHPDSDFGPEDEKHPMINRTIIDGVSASDPSRAAYRTK